MYTPLRGRGLDYDAKVPGSSLTWAYSSKTPPVHPAASGYLTLVGEGQAAKREG